MEPPPLHVREDRPFLLSRYKRNVCNNGNGAVVLSVPGFSSRQRRRAENLERQRGDEPGRWVRFGEQNRVYFSERSNRWTDFGDQTRLVFSDRQSLDNFTKISLVWARQSSRFPCATPSGNPSGMPEGGSGNPSGVPEGARQRVVKEKTRFSQSFTTHLEIGFAAFAS